MRHFSGPGQYDTSEYFRGACEALDALGVSDLIVSPGDIDPVDHVEWTIQQHAGPAAVWLPVVGNHELPDAGTEPYPGANMDRLRSYDHPGTHLGPSGCVSTTYSFDYDNVHFVVLNEYCDSAGDTATQGDIGDHLYWWLAADLATTDKAHIFVFGHEPAYPQPDADNGRLRHQDDSLNQYAANRDRFWNLLAVEGVTAYICGHTHNYSAVQIDGVWQVDVGHARGLGDVGAPSTFVVFQVGDEVVRFETYRDDAAGGPYVLRHAGTLAWQRIYLPALMSPGD
jgi:hypothetical protein